MAKRKNSCAISPSTNKINKKVKTEDNSVNCENKNNSVLRKTRLTRSANKKREPEDDATTNDSCDSNTLVKANGKNKNEKKVNKNNSKKPIKQDLNESKDIKENISKKNDKKTKGKNVLKGNTNNVKIEESDEIEKEESDEENNKIQKEDSDEDDKMEEDKLSEPLDNEKNKTSNFTKLKNTQDINLSESDDDSENELPDEKNNKITIKEPVIKKEKIVIQKKNNSPKKNTTPKKKSTQEEIDESIRRSSRKKNLRFNLKELVSSESELSFGDDEDEEISEPEEKFIPKRKKSLVKKVDTGKKKIKLSYNDGSDSDEYRPDKISSEESEESDLEEVEPSEESDNSGEESDTDKRVITKKAPVVRRSVNFVKHNSDDEVSRSKKTTKQGLPKVYSTPQSVGAKSQFGNGSCIKRLLNRYSTVTKKYNEVKKESIKKKIAECSGKDPTKEENLMDILYKFECEDGTDGKAKKSKNDSDDSDDFEEVEDANIKENFEDYDPDCLKEGVTIELQPSYKPNPRKKNPDWIYDTIRQNVNRQRRDIYMNATKANILCYIARANYLNRMTMQDLPKALAMSSNFFDKLSTKVINISFLEKFVKKYHQSYEFVYDKSKSQLDTSQEAIIECFETKKTNHPTVYNLVFLILYRTFCSINNLEENSRVCIAFKPIDFKPDDLLMKPKKNPAKKNKVAQEIEDEESEKSKSKKPAAKGKSKKKDVDSEEDLDDDSELDEKPKKKSAKGKGKKAPAKSKKSSNEEEKEDLPEKKVIIPLNKKKLVEIWIEIYAAKENEWVTIELVNEIFNEPDDLEKIFYVDPLYIISFNSKNYIKDLTFKYISKFYLHSFKRFRCENEWLDEVYSYFRPTEPAQDEIDEDKKYKKIALSKPLPKSLAEFKSHGLYILERHLLKYEVIYPQDAPVEGYFNEDRIYRREFVESTHSKEYWKREARQLKKDEEPYKMSTARPKWDRSIQDYIKGLPLALYGHWQTEDYDPGDVVNGKVPRNEFGNVDLFKPCMLPRGSVHLKLNGLLKIAQKLNIDCVPAITGFDLKNAATIPIVDGFVVPIEHEEELTRAWEEQQEKTKQKDHDKYYLRVYGNWKKLVKGLLIAKKIREKYKSEFDA